MAQVELRAEMAGTVMSVEVSPGDAVSADAELLVIESMKMEIPVSTPASGRVVSVAVAPGDVVDESTLLMTIET